jgi:hypothetical protein
MSNLVARAAKSMHAQLLKSVLEYVIFSLLSVYYGVTDFAEQLPIILLSQY